jgi:hypothetical protein
MVVHKTLQQFNKNHRLDSFETKPQDVCKELLGTFKQEWGKAEKNLSALGISQDRIESFRHESELMLINFAHWICGTDLHRANLSEVKMWSKDLMVMGVIDAVHISGDKVILVDYKTSKDAKITDEIMRQAALYALLYLDRFKRAPDAVWIHFLRMRDDPLPVHVDEPLLDYGRILVESIHDKTTSRNEGDYPCKCGGWCEREFMKDQNGND